MIKLLFLIVCAFVYGTQNAIPIYIREFGIEIQDVEKLGDTIFYNKSSKEDFKLVFFDTKGKCYFERFINNKLYQKGEFENSLDTLKRYVSGRNISGYNSPIIVQKYFEPLKSGTWVTYDKSKKNTEKYLLGIAQ